jgi:tetratricopeptide (TPR) repeat protein
MFAVDPSPLVQQGIAAYKAGNKEEAVRLLSDAIRQNRNDETAWLYLGAAIEDPDRKRKAFEQVLTINPDNDKAKNALARLDAGVSGSTAKPSGGAGSGAQVADKPKAGSKLWESLSQESFTLPFRVSGAPETVTIPRLTENARAKILEVSPIVLNRDYAAHAGQAQSAVMWDSVFIAMVGVIATGLAEFLGRLVGWVTSLFRGGILGLLIFPLFSAIVGMTGVAAGFAASVYGTKYYLENQGIKVNFPQLSMYYAVVFLPLILANAVFTFVSHAIPFLRLPLLLMLLGVAGYGLYMLKGAFDRIYGTDNNIGLITAAIAVGGWAVGNLLAIILFGMFRLG